MKISRTIPQWVFAGLVVVALMFLLVDVAAAIPAFSRKYKTSCSTCHYAFPQLNAFGKAFRNNGYRYPGGDENFRKEDPVELGSEAYKRVWPDAIWPSDIPGTGPFAIHAIGRYNMSFNQPDTVANNTFEFPHEVELLYGGTIGEEVSFFGEVEFETEGDEIVIAFPFRLEINHRRAFNVSLGSQTVDPTPNHMRLTRTKYNVSALKSRNEWRLEDEQSGVQLWGAGNGSGGKGGWRYGAGIVNGQGVVDANRDKDLFASVTYKIGGLGEIGGTEGQASETSAFYRDNNLTIGGLVYSGREAGATAAEKEDLTVLLGTADFWYGRLIVNASMLSMKSDISGLLDRKSLAWYAQGQYVLYPWLIGIARLESTDSDTDDTADARTTLVPAVVGMLRANVKFTLDYKRPLSDYDARKVGEEGFTAQANISF
jgi:hypothetical protein